MRTFCIFLYTIFIYFSSFIDSMNFIFLRKESLELASLTLMFKIWMNSSKRFIFKNLKKEVETTRDHRRGTGGPPESLLILNDLKSESFTRINTRSYFEVSTLSFRYNSKKYRYFFLFIFD